MTNFSEVLFASLILHRKRNEAFRDGESADLKAARERAKSRR